MPKQISDVLVTDNGNDTVDIQIGDFIFRREKTVLFDRTPDHNQIRNNLRLAFQIGGYSELASKEFLNGVNGHLGQGMEGKDGQYKIDNVSLRSPDSEIYDVTFTDRRGQTFVIPVIKGELEMQWNDPSIIIDNLVPFLRISGKNELTPAAVNQIKAAKFWY